MLHVTRSPLKWFDDDVSRENVANLEKDNSKITLPEEAKIENDKEEESGNRKDIEGEQRNDGISVKKK